jgi:hypothetical protein
MVLRGGKRGTSQRHDTYKSKIFLRNRLRSEAMIVLRQSCNLVKVLCKVRSPRCILNLAEANRVNRDWGPSLMRLGSITVFSAERWPRMVSVAFNVSVICTLR